MGKSTKYLESSATAEENSYDYRVEWDDLENWHLYDGRMGEKTEHLGPGYEVFIKNYEQAYDRYSMCYDNSQYKGLRLIRIYPDGHEVVLQHTR